MAIDLRLIDKLLLDYKKPEDIIGENGLLKQLTKAVLERAMQVEMTCRGLGNRWPIRGSSRSLWDRRQQPSPPRRCAPWWPTGEGPVPVAWWMRMLGPLPAPTRQ